MAKIAETSHSTVLPVLHHQKMHAFAQLTWDLAQKRDFASEVSIYYITLLGWKEV